MTETIDICRGEARIYAAPVTKDSMRKFELMKEDSVTLKFSTGYDSVPSFAVGDHISVDGERYVIKEAASPAYNATTGGFDFTLVFVAEYMAWANLLMKSVKLTSAGAKTFGETEWNYTATLEEHACAILRCVYLHAGLNVSDTQLPNHVYIDNDYIANAEERKHIAYNATNVLAALDELCKGERYACEWWVKPNGKYFEMHFGRLAKNAGATYIVKQGENGIISRQQSQNKYANRIYVYGGTQNVPYSYRKTLIFTNWLQDGNLADDNRPIKPEWVEGACRHEDDDFVFDGFQFRVSERLEQIYRTRVPIVARMSSSDSFGALSRPKGTYKVIASNVDSLVELSYNTPTKYGWMSKVVAMLKIWRNGLPFYEETKDVTDKVRIVNNVGTNADGAFVSVDFGDQYVDLDEDGDIEAWIEFEVWVGSLTAGTLNITCRSRNEDAKTLMRTDKYMALVTIHDIESDELYGGEWMCEHGREAICPFEAVQVNKYRVQGFIDYKIPTSYYTPDDGDDVINGLTEMRLRLPAVARRTPEGYISHNGYIETPTAATGGAIVESSVTHDDIFPAVTDMRITAVDDSETRKASVTYSDGTTSEKDYKVYRIFAKMSNGQAGAARVEYDFKREYILGDLDTRLKVKFLNGALGGMTFEAILDEENQSYLIVPNKDYGIQLPDDNLKPDIGNEIMLLGWDARCMEQLGIIEAAEEKLLAEAAKDLKSASEGSYTYNVTMLPDTSDVYAQLEDEEGNLLEDSTGEQLLSQGIDLQPTFYVGSAVKLIDPSLFDVDSGPLRVIGFEMHLDIPWDEPKYIIGEIPKPSRTQTLERKTNELETELSRKSY